MSVTTARDVTWGAAVPIGELDQWQVNAVTQVLELAKLPQNWDSYGSPAPARAAIDAAAEVLAQIPFADLPVPVVVPVAGGGLQMEWAIGDRELELEFLPSGTATYLKVERNDFEEGDLGPASIRPLRARALLNWLRSR